MLRVDLIILKLIYINYSLANKIEKSKKEAKSFLKNKIGTVRLTDIYDWDDYIKENKTNDNLHYYYGIKKDTSVFMKVYQELSNFSSM